MDSLEKGGPCLPLCCVDKERNDQQKEKQRERLKRENEITAAALRICRSKSKTNISEEEILPTVEKCVSVGGGDWVCIDQVGKTVDYRLAGLNSIERLVLKYFGPEDVPPSSGSTSGWSRPQPRYPFTLASQLKRRECLQREADAKSTDVQRVLKSRLEELLRLKKRLGEDSGRFRCHLDERKTDMAEKKRKLVEKLAITCNLPPELLQKRADEIYDNYRRNVAREKNFERKKIEQQIQIYNKLIAERKKKTLSSKPKPVATKVLKAMSPTPQEGVGVDGAEVVVEEVKETGDEKIEKAEHKEKPVSKKITLKVKKEKGKKSEKGKSKKGKSKSSKSSSKKKSGPSKKKEKEPPREPTVAVQESLDNIFFPDLVGGFKDWEALEEAKAKFYNSTLPRLPQERGFVSVPPAIVIKDYEANIVYRYRLSLTNTSLDEVHCRFSNITYHTDEIALPFEVEPTDNQRVPPGLSIDFILSFSPDTGVQETEATLEFITQRSDQDLRMFPVDVRCTPRSAVPAILTKNIVFPKVGMWTNEVHKKFLKISNAGLEPCVAYIRRPIVGTPKIVIPNGSLSNSLMMIRKYRNACELSTTQQETTDLDEAEMQIVEPASRPQSAKKAKKMLADEEYEIKRLEEVETKRVMNDILNEAVDNVFHVFRFEKLHGIVIHPKSEVKIPILFLDYMMPYSGYAICNYQVTFDGKFIKEKKQSFSVEGEVEPLPVELIPSVINMKHCLISGGVQQTTFAIKNSGHIPYPILVKIPKSLTPHVHADPVDPFAHPNSSATVVLRIMLRRSFCRDALKYFNPETNVLDFPVYVYVHNRQLELVRRLDLSVLAVVTTVLDLTISPSCIDLGVVTTMETSQATFYLTNHSVTTHQYAFLNTPQCVIIMPNYGFGTIGPEESVKLHLLYSPGNEQVPQPGDDHEHSFILRCTTMTRLANHPELPMKAVPKLEQYSDVSSSHNHGDNISLLCQKLALIEEEEECDYNVTKSMEISMQQNALNYEEVISDSALFDKLLTINLPTFDGIPLRSNFGNNPSTPVPVNEEQETQPLDTAGSEIFPMDSTIIHEQLISCTTQLYIELHCKAHVIDPLCELSVQKVYFSPTPCYSYSILSLYLRSPNRSTHHGCYCGKIQGIENNLNKQFEANFEFYSNKMQLDVQPRTGKISMGECIKIFLILKPVLNNGDVMKAAKEIKMYEAREKLLEKWRLKAFQKSKAKDSIKKKKKKPDSKAGDKSKSGSKKTEKKGVTNDIHGDPQSCFFVPVKEPEFKIDPAKLKISAKEIFAAKKNLLEIMETHGFEASIRCMVETMFLKSGDKRREVLKCQVFCPIIRPDILVDTPDEEPILKFGRTAIGSKKEITIKVHNISRTKVRVNHSMLNPIGSFRCPILIPLSEGLRKVKKEGILLKPESWLEIPIVFEPQHSGTINEYFEIRSAKTTFSLNANGEGIVPKYKIKPEFGVQYMESAEQKTAECIIMVQNECDAPLSFYVWKLYTLIGNEPEEPPVDPDLINNEKGSKSKKEKSKRKSAGKGTQGTKSTKKETNHDITLKPYMMEALEKSFVKIDEQQAEQIFVDSGPFTLLPKKKGQLTFKFTPPATVKKIDAKTETTNNDPKNAVAHKPKKKLTKGSQQKGTSHSKSKQGKKAKASSKSKQAEPKKVYVCKFTVTVGLLPIADWIFWGRVNKKGGPKSGKKIR